MSKDSVLSLQVEGAGSGQQRVESPRGQPSVLVSEKVVVASCERHIASWDVVVHCRFEVGGCAGFEEFWITVFTPVLVS